MEETDEACLSELSTVPWAALAAPDVCASSPLLVKANFVCVADSQGGGDCSYALCATDCARVWVASAFGDAMAAEMHTSNPHLDFALVQATNIARDALCSADGRPLLGSAGESAVSAEIIGGKKDDEAPRLRLTVVKKIGFGRFVWPFVLHSLGADARAEVLRAHLVLPLLMVCGQMQSALEKLHVAPPALPVDVLRTGGRASVDAVSLGSVGSALYTQVMRLRGGSLPNVPVRRGSSLGALDALAVAADATATAAEQQQQQSTAVARAAAESEEELALKRTRELEERLKRDREKMERKLEAKKRKLDFV